VASVTKRKWKKPDGSMGEAWMVRYVDATGARRGKTFDLKKQAEAFKQKMEREMHDGTHVADRDAATVEKVVAAFLASSEVRYRDGRIGATRLDWLHRCGSKFIVPALGKVRFRDLTTAQIEALYADLTLKRGLAPTTARSILAGLRTIESFARKRGYLRTAPVAEAMKELRGIKADPIRTFSTDEAALVLRTVLTRRKGDYRRTQAMLACMVHLAGCCGLRSGEIRALDLDHLDLDAGEVRVRRSVTEYREIKGPKTPAGNRNVPLPAHLVAMLRDWLDNHYKPCPDRLVFTFDGKRTISHSTLNHRWLSLLDRCGLAKEGDQFHFHALRHFAASWWIENGLSLPEVAQMLGHSKVDMTLTIYAHSLVRPHARREMMQAMATRLTTAENDNVVPLVTHSGHMTA